MKESSNYIQQRILKLQNPEKAAWLERYVKHDITSLGVGIPEIRNIVHAAEKEFTIGGLPFDKQKQILDDLTAQKYTEYKLAAILYVQIYGNAYDPSLVLQMIGNWFDQEWINDWNVCDWLCVRVLSRMVDEYPEISIQVFNVWNESDYLWKARASLVPFAECQTLLYHIVTIIKFSNRLIRREERFCKTAVGWVLRQYSRHDAEAVKDFLSVNKEWTTKEVVKNATKYLK